MSWQVSGFLVDNNFYAEKRSLLFFLWVRKTRKLCIFEISSAWIFCIFRADVIADVWTWGVRTRIFERFFIMGDLKYLYVSGSHRPSKFSWGFFEWFFKRGSSIMCRICKWLRAKISSQGNRRTRIAHGREFGQLSTEFHVAESAP